MNTSKITNIEIDGIDTKDAPDFCDAFILSADYNGVPLTEDQLDEINENSDFVYDKVLDSLY